MTESIRSHARFASVLLINLTSIALTAHCSASAAPDLPHTVCDNRTLRQATGFEMHFDPALRSGVVGQRIQVPIVVRFPKNGAEVHAASHLKCNGLIPAGSQITQLQIRRVTGLPHGLTLHSANTSNSFAGGETACFWVKGTPEIAGNYNVEIESIGTGHYLGISTTNNCTLRIENIVISN